MATSVYLSNNIIKAVVGSGGKKVSVKKIFKTEIPEGSLINGIITNEAELSEQLNAFWTENKIPKKDVTLVINSSQFTLKTLSLPKAKDKKLRELVAMEFSDVADQNDLIYDYMLDPVASSGNMLSLHAVAAERSFVQGFINLFASIGVAVSSITTSRTCTIKALQSLKQLKKKTCIVQSVDGSSISSILWVNGTSNYYTQRRVFCEAGTQQFGAEIARLISNILQFASTQQIQEGIREVYLTGVTDEEFDIYSASVDELGIGVSLEKLDRERHIRLNKKIQAVYSDYLGELGSFLKVKQDINLAAKAKKKVKKKDGKEVVWKRYVIVPAILLVLLGTLAGMLFYSNSLKQDILDELVAYNTDPANTEICEKADALEVAIAEMSREIYQIGEVKASIESYPDVNSEVVSKLRECASGKGVTFEIRSYSAQTGNLSVDAKARQVTNINTYIDTLGSAGVFDTIEYSGYAYDEQTKMYTINMNCYLSENAGK